MDENLPSYRPDGRALGILFEDVDIWGTVAGESRAQDLLAIFEDILFRWPTKLFRQVIGRSLHQTRKLVHSATGVVPPGETLLVLGRPGAGCSTLLKVLANQRGSFTGVDGTVQYGGIDSAEMRKHYGSEVVYNAEDDLHFPTLSVAHTMAFALKLRKPRRLRGEPDAQFARRMADRILDALKIGHTKDTIVGDAFVRGVSGGERKRVSLAEVLAAAPAVVCWDNPLRGLDSSSALMFLQLLKAMSSATGMTNVVTAYQISETIYRECFDRVLVLYEGRVIYSGHGGDAAKEYFTRYLGFHCPMRQTTPDFLSAVTSPEEQRVQVGFQPRPPIDPDGLAEAFRRSSQYQTLQADVQQYRDKTTKDVTNYTNFQAEVDATKDSMTSKSSLTIRSPQTQLLAAMTRCYQLIWGGRRNLFTVISLNAINALVLGAAYRGSPTTSTGAFQRSGGVFFALIFFALNALAETGAAVRTRPVLRKHHGLGMLSPGLAAVAQTVADLPVCFVQTICFTIPYYFLMGPPTSAGGYWFFELVVFVTYAAFMAVFRLLGAAAPNVPVALMLGGVAMPVLLLYSGYAPPWPTQLRWGSWIRWIGPDPYSLEALMGFEFWGLTLQCGEDELVPSGPGYENITISNQGCPIPGSTAGLATVSGPKYLAAQFEYLPTDAWRNFGIVLCFWVGYTILQALAQTYATKRGEGSVVGRVYKRGAVVPGYATGTIQDPEKELDLEAQSRPTSLAGQRRAEDSSASMTQVEDNEPSLSFDGKASFTFSKISYQVSTSDGPRTLLNSVSGYVKPGQLTALMGVSGAGKTTLLDTLAQRKTDGTVSGEMVLGGRSVVGIGKAFSQACGFCMQQGVHDPGTTVREALVFSAMMRRPLSVPKAEKLAHVDRVVDLLALAPIADALIGTPGEGGLGVEERKRLTIGVELAADPSALLFLDEPTSGLDSQAAYSLVQFLQGIAAAGVPIICTIHQPSAVIFDMFDHILLLAPGGRTVYFGETGDNSGTVVDYFSRNGVTMDSTANPAEFILDTVADPSMADQWSHRWNESVENQKILQQVETMNQQPTKDELESHSLPFFSQLTLLIARHATSVWRDGFYSFSRLAKTIFLALFISFSFFMPAHSLQGVQNRILIMLLLQWIVPATAADLQDVWYAKWALFTARERSGVGYNPLALCAALVAVEIPLALVLYTLAFVCSWFTVGLGQAGFGYLCFLALGVFGIGFPFAVASLSADAEVAGYANSLVWCVMATFGGIAIPHSGMNDFYRPWLFWADPMRYWLGATVSAALHGVPVSCADSDMTMLRPPAGLTCGEYLSEYLGRMPGYVQDPDGIESCAFCPYSVGDEYAAQFEFFFSDRWRDWGVFAAFCVSTLAIAFLVSGLRYGGGWKIFKRKSSAGS
ncbi:hypothetical protein Daus18300_009060 [Diaporthe australafricana]|uniref:ABC transporter domain-containing protein n=1 Tax=Diaporthe australafricana TaxID=127596 RepID=A0ABR3WFU1_9PEZI